MNLSIKLSPIHIISTQYILIQYKLESNFLCNKLEDVNPLYSLDTSEPILNWKDR